MVFCIDGLLRTTSGVVGELVVVTRVSEWAVWTIMQRISFLANLEHAYVRLRHY